MKKSIFLCVSTILLISSCNNTNFIIEDSNVKDSIKDDKTSTNNIDKVKYNNDVKKVEESLEDKLKVKFMEDCKPPKEFEEIKDKLCTCSFEKVTEKLLSGDLSKELEPVLPEIFKTCAIESGSDVLEKKYEEGIFNSCKSGLPEEYKSKEDEICGCFINGIKEKYSTFEEYSNDREAHKTLVPELTVSCTKESFN